MKEDNNVMMETTKFMIHFLVQNNRISTILHAKQRLWRININYYCKTMARKGAVTKYGQRQRDGNDDDDDDDI